MATKKPEHKPSAAHAHSEHTPDVAEAKQMFRDNPGLAHVLTTEGMLSRDGGLDTSLKPKE